MSRLLVLGADPLREAAFATWLRHGHQITLLDAASARYAPLVDHYAPLEVRDGRGDSAVVVNQAGNHDAVLTLSDQSQVVAATVAERLGLAGPGLPAATLARSKAAQRALAHRTGLEAPRFRHVVEPSNLDAFFAEVNGPAILKPSGGTASTAVCRVDSPAEARAAWPRVAAFSGDGTGIIEELLDGAEISVEAVVRHGEVVWASVTEKETGGASGFLEVGHVVDRLAEVTARTSAARAAVQEIASAWQVDSAVMHLEFKIRSTGRLTLIEAAVRPAGGLICEIVGAVTGVDLYQVHADLALGAAPATAAPVRPTAACAGVRFLIGSGVVRRTVEVAEVTWDLPLIWRVEQLVQPGRRVLSPVGGWGRSGYALGWGNDRAGLTMQLVQAVERMRETMGLAEITPDRGITMPLNLS